MKPVPDYRVYLVTDRPLCKGRDVVDVVAAAAAGGVTMVQLREKDISGREFVELGRALMDVLAPRQIPLLINDRVDVALAIGAQGVHVGQSDIPYADVRAIMGPEAIIGLSVETMEQALNVPDLDQLPGGALGPDYLGVGPIFATSTKQDAAPVWGVELLAALRSQTSQTLVAIGGISTENAGEVMQAGADGVAVVSAIVSADDPEAAAKHLRKTVNAAKGVVEMEALGGQH